jgi:hypothetical protein
VVDFTSGGASRTTVDGDVLNAIVTNRKGRSVDLLRAVLGANGSALSRDDPSFQRLDKRVSRGWNPPFVVPADPSVEPRTRECPVCAKPAASASSACMGEFYYGRGCQMSD